VERPRLRLPDVLLFLLAAVVVAVVTYTVKQGLMMPSAADVGSAQGAIPANGGPSRTPAATATATATPTPTRGPLRRVVLLGEDLTDRAVVSTLADTLGTTVKPVRSRAVTPVPSAVYTRLLPGPGVVVIQLPRASTARSDALAAVEAIRSRARGTKVVLVGPVRTGDSYGAALKALTGFVIVTYLDPVAEHWVTPATKASLTVGQRQQLAAHLARDLAPLLR